MTVCADSSGNGNNGSYSGATNYAPGIIPGASAAQCGTGNIDLTVGGVGPFVTFDWSADWSIDFWVAQLLSPQFWPLPRTMVTVLGITNLGGPTFISLSDGISPGFAPPSSSDHDGDVQFFSALSGDRWYTPVAAYPLTKKPPGWYINEIAGFFDPGAPPVQHHVAYTHSGSGSVASSIKIYVDGAAFTVIDAAPGTGFGLNLTNSRLELGFSVNMILAGYAFYTSVLSAGRVAAHHTAGLASIGAYSAAVLADSPFAYYILNDAP